MNRRLEMLQVLMRRRGLLTQVNGSSSHSNLALTQALARILTKFSSWKDWGEVLEALECVVFVEAAANEGRGEGVYIPEPQKLAVIVLLCTYWNFLQFCRNFLQK